MEDAEEWRDIDGFAGIYQVSNLGRIKSLSRMVRRGNGNFYRTLPELILHQSLNTGGYPCVGLSSFGLHINKSVHQIVAAAFLGHTPSGLTYVIDHKNGVKTDNRDVNLRIVTTRENTSVCFRKGSDNYVSKFVGVCWNKNAKKWQSNINVFGTLRHLGLFIIENDASEAYQKALSCVLDGTFDDYYNSIKPKYSSKFKGVSFIKSSGRWRANVTINGKTRGIGSFESEIKAFNRRVEYLKTIPNLNSL